MFALNREKLFNCLSVDDIQVDEQVLQNAENGDGYALNKIGDIYYSNEDYLKAMEWYHLGAAKNNEFSQFRLGWIYAKGKGIPTNYGIALQWYLAAFEKLPMVGNNIGYLFGTGQGVIKNYQVALKWFLHAARTGNCCAQYNVGVYYEKGYGVDVDKQQALEWFEKSACQGDEDGQESVKRLNEQGFYMDNTQHKKNMEVLKLKIDSLDDQLKISKQKELQYYNENRLLKREKELLELKLYMDKKDQVKADLNWQNYFQHDDQLD